MADSDAFDEFYRRTSESLFGELAASTTDREQTSCVVQTAYEKAWRRWSRVATLAHPERWVRDTAVRLLPDEDDRCDVECQPVVSGHASKGMQDLRVWDSLDSTGRRRAVWSATSSDSRGSSGQHLPGAEEIRAAVDARRAQLRSRFATAGGALALLVVALVPLARHDTESAPTPTPSTPPHPFRSEPTR